MKYSIKYSFLLFFVCFIIGCTSHPKDVTDSDMYPDIYPDYVDVTIPNSIAPLNFGMNEDSYDRIDVEIIGKNGTSLHSSGNYADFDEDNWHKLLAQNIGRDLSVTVIARQNGKWTRFRPFHIYVSEDSLNEWGVTYRRIAPSYIVYSEMGLYQRDLSSFNEMALIKNTQVPGACLNCHTSNATNPDQYLFHVRGGHGATVIQRDGTLQLLKARNDSLGGSMVYPCWHPNGRYIAFSTNSTAQMFHTRSAKRIEVYDSSSDVFVYDTETHTILNDSLLMRENWAENTPAFSGDGKWLYFTTAPRQNFPKDYDRECYSICRVAFDVEKATFVGDVDTLIHAILPLSEPESVNDSSQLITRSVTWPRPSYNGRFLMYTQVNHGYFSVWHPESDIWLMDLKTGECRAINEINSERAESQHKWSTNSRWFLFTSRREDGLYTRIYFAHIDENGNVSKPFLLPQKNPKLYYSQSLYSFNTPDFASKPIDPDPQKMGKKIEDAYRVDTKVLK